MPATYVTPGVYVEEVDRGSKPIEAAGASMAASSVSPPKPAIKPSTPKPAIAFPVNLFSTKPPWSPTGPNSKMFLAGSSTARICRMPSMVIS